MAEASASSLEEALGYVDVMDAALISELPDKELKAVERHCHPPAHVDVERHFGKFMAAASILDLFFKGLVREYQPTREQVLRKEIAALEEELKVKDAVMRRHHQLISKRKQLLQSQKAANIDALEKV